MELCWLVMIVEFAPAKINLYLHITGRREDGYHDLDSLVAFAGVSDEIRLEASEAFSFVVEGPQGAHLNGEPAADNLVVKAARSFAELTGKKLNVKLTLIKNLPVASGIGGGSSDAAATLRALAKHWGIALTDPRLLKAAAHHGQDVPVCLTTESNYITATGTVPAHDIPYADILLINPNKPLSTPDVYKNYKNNPHNFSSPSPFDSTLPDVNALVEALALRGNDLYEPRPAFNARYT
jgi:4-diphosphocytidyl-2-C-methyl-D-erythritol kinase